MRWESCKQNPAPYIQVIMILGTAFVLLLFISIYMASLTSAQIETLSSSFKCSNTRS